MLICCAYLSLELRCPVLHRWTSLTPAEPCCPWLPSSATSSPTLWYGQEPLKLSPASLILSCPGDPGPAATSVGQLLHAERLQWPHRRLELHFGLVTAQPHCLLAEKPQQPQANLASAAWAGVTGACAWTAASTSDMCPSSSDPIEGQS